MENANRGVFRGQITKLTKSAIDYLNSPESQVKEENAEHFDEAVEELTAMLSRLTAAHDNLRKANENVRPLVKAEDFEKECEAIMEYDDKVINCVSRIKCRLERIIVIRDKILSPSNLQLAPMEKQRAVKLPKLDLKKFSGDYKEWLPFWEQYKTLIHENNNLSVSDKFNYLQSALYGKAAASIAGFPPNKDCYDAAIALLQEEYGNTERLIEKHMQQLMTLSPVVSRHDAGGLRCLYNTVVTNTRTLTTLGVSSNNYYVMLKSILLKCIPNDLRIEFYKTSSVVEKTILADSKDHAVGDDDAHSLSSVATSGSISLDIDSGVKHLLKFIKREVESIEKAGSTVKSSNTYSSSNAKLVKTAAGLLVSSEGKQFCIFCKSSGHFTDRCDGKQTLSERKDILKRNGRCFKCTRKGHTSRTCTTRNIRCSKCTGRHVPSMCDPHFSRRSDAVCQRESTVQPSTNLYSFTAHFPTVYLQTACAYMSALTNKVDSSILVRILLDSGSQLSYIRKNVADKLNLKIVDTVKIRILPFGCSETTPMMCCNRVKVLLRSIHDDKAVIITAVVVPEICLDTLPVPDISKPEISKYILADSRQFGSPEEGISLLIGSDFYWNVVSGEFERIKANLTAVKTNLGWIIQGPEAEQQDNNIFDPVTLSVALCDAEKQFSTDVQKLWDLESLGITNFDLNTNIITEHCVRRIGNRYEASLLWQDIDSPLSNYREGAYQRFKNLVRRLSREPKKLMEYDEAMNELIQAGFAEMVKNEMCHENRIYYMPHRPVYREDKSTTKLRVVFDASAHATGCRSLNDHLDAGPNLLPDILSVLLRFRLRKIALVADVEKAFLQIVLASKDRDVHRFFWFSERLKHSEDLPAFQEYRMTRVTFGVKCSPFLLGAVLQQHLKEESIEYPEICEILRKAFYMDDLVLSIDDEELAERIYSSTCTLMKRASFNIRKWNSNNLSLRAKMKKDADPPNKQKVLGAIWYCLSDEIAVDLDQVREFISSIVTVTKRTVLQLIARIFDPLGMLSPFIIKLKILFQDLWRLKLSWDDVLPKEFMTIWSKCCVEFQCLQHIFLPRCIKDLDEPHACQLHIFADASPSAYGAVAYMRLQSNNEVRIKYICSKNRVAPLKGGGDKQLTLPKLELTAALIAARLRKYVEKTLQLKWEKVNLWTDSKITLCWINGDIRRWNSYVSGRVNEIRKHCLLNEWRHCPGEQNPADFLTRGVPGKNVANSEIWIEGPSWLSKEDKDWPQPSAETEIEPKSRIFLQIISEVGVEFNDEALFDFTRFSSYVRILRITAYIRRFVNKTRNNDESNNRFLVAKELEIAEEFWIHYIQRKYYCSELNALTAGKPVPAHSSILSLNPILDENKILRVGSRLKYLNNDFDSSFPIILPRSNHLTMLIVRDAHERLLHGGVSAVLCRLREKFWVPRARQLIKGVTKKCNVCRRMFGKPANQPFAPLPRNRLSSSRPFETTGVDFAGPLYVRISSDDSSTRKVYIMLLTCSAVRAVHVEMVPDMTVESCLLALRRFIARRGVPKTMISDNARTFKRASKEINDIGRLIWTEKFQGFVSNHKISWDFIVERAPWWGGFWERLVRSIKNILRLTIGRAVLTAEEMGTILTEVESIINSRPLTYIGDDPLDLSPLTPSHFLHTPISISSPDVCIGNATSANLRDIWKAHLKLVNSFWKRWRMEYVQLLRSVHHSRKVASENCLREGDVVLVYNQNTPRVLWRLAVIENIYPGRDGKARACEVRFHDGSCLRRPIQHLYPLEVRNE